VGTEVEMTLEDDLKTKAKLCTCILFMGGDDKEHLNNLKACLEKCRDAGFKTALYTGRTLDKIDHCLLHLLDYIKVGPYSKECGGLKSRTTNQRLYKLNEAGQIVKDLTPLFRRTLDEDCN
jgi:anaerobic ribonucleoside-triphosphate reductase activating protein